MNIKHSTKLISIVILSIIFLGLTLAYVTFPSNEVRVQSNVVQYETLDKLTDEADLIIFGTMEKDFSSFKPTITYNPEGRMDDFYTVTDVKINKVYKGIFNQKYVPVSQVAVLKDSLTKLNKDMIIDENYSIMEKNKKYILFLKKVENYNFYSIISVYQGKYNIDGLDMNEDKFAGESDTYKKLKKEIIEKYK